MSEKPLVFTVTRIPDLEAFEPKRQQTKEALAAAFDDVHRDFWISTIIAGLLEGTVIGAAVWYPPGREMYDSEDQRKQALGMLIDRFQPTGFWDWWAQDFLPKYDKCANEGFGEGVKLASWHLQTLGVHPEYQGKGVGRALIEVIKPKAAKDGVPMVLEAEKENNVTIYGKIGFRAPVPPTTFKGPAGEFPMWPLIHDVPKV
ncbi:hypothetical protein BDQ17DRAFT_1347002 [Cyathus striatus]|nr:hypothetical protein BDQ17DRAFT_1347002 [Cyathus striatus]